jgi:hypothetical protein
MPKQKNSSDKKYKPTIHSRIRKYKSKLFKVTIYSNSRPNDKYNCTQIGDQVYTAEVSSKQLKELAMDPNIRRIE